MKKYFTFLILLCLTISCHTTKTVVEQPANKSVVATHSGNGTSFADAVIITEKRSESAIAVEEKAWLNERYPGYNVLSTRSENKPGADGSPKLYNIYKIKTTDEAEFEVFFDVSIFYNIQAK
jgi:hypothetical protein